MDDIAMTGDGPADDKAVTTHHGRPNEDTAAHQVSRAGARRPYEHAARVRRAFASGWRWSALLLLIPAVLAAHFAIQAIFHDPAPVSGASGVAWGTIVSIARSGSEARVRLDGGRTVTAQVDNGRALGSLRPLVMRFHAGDRVGLAYYLGPAGTYVFSVSDFQRTPALVWMLLLFIAVAAIVGRGKALRAVLGTAGGLAVILGVVVPAILAGANPVLVALAGAGGVLAISMYFVHGLNWKTTAALCGTAATILVALAVADVFLHSAHITSFGTEDSVYLLSGHSKVSIQGLVLSGVVIGALGALVDVTVGQASAVAELAHLGGPSLGLWELYERGMRVGLDHIGSLINTLVLAYVGTSLPIIVLLARYSFGWRQILNLEFLGVQMLQTLVGAIALVLAVPFTTFVAASLFRGGRRAGEGTGHVHSHVHAHI